MFHVKHHPSSLSDTETPENVAEEVVGSSTPENVAQANLCVPQFLRDKFKAVPPKRACLPEIRARRSQRFDVATPGKIHTFERLTVSTN